MYLEKEKIIRLLKSIGSLIVSAAAIALLFWLSNKSHDPPKAEKHFSLWSKKGIDTVYTDDSAYVIHFKIDTSFGVIKEYEPAERPN